MFKQATKMIPKSKDNYSNAARMGNKAVNSVPKVTKATKFTGVTNTKTLALKKPHKKMM